MHGARVSLEPFEISNNVHANIFIDFDRFYQTDVIPDYFLVHSIENYKTSESSENIVMSGAEVHKIFTE